MNRQRQSGFTLLEMLAALTLMAVSCSVLLVAFGQSARSLLQVSHTDRLTQAALTILDQETSGPLVAGSRQGRLGDDIHWQLNIAQQPGRDDQTRLFRLDVTVSEANREAHFSTLKLRSATQKARL